MFMIRNVSKLLFGDNSKESLIELPQGQLFLIRPLSPKGYSELIFKDAAAAIRRTGQEYNYQLVVQRVLEEGEAELLAEEDDEGEVEDVNPDKDEKAFLLDAELHLRVEVRDFGETVFAWRDLSGEERDLWEFVCDRSVPRSTAEKFELAALQCQYERKYRQPHTQATAKDLEEFRFSEGPIPEASPLTSPASRSPSLPSIPPSANDLKWAPRTERDDMAKKSNVAAQPSQAGTSATSATAAPPAGAHKGGQEVLAKAVAELHLFDFDSATFVLQDPKVTATVSDDGKWNYWLQITGEEREWLGQAVVAETNPVTNFEYKSFIFNHWTEDGSAYSWLLRFKDQEALEEFQKGFHQALWEHLNETKWVKARQTDQEYVLEAFQDLTMEDAPPLEEEEDEDQDEEEEENVEDRSEHYDSDESADDVVHQKDGNINSQLAVGYKHDRSFVVRGSNIGVFKHTPDNHLQFATNISKVQTPKGKLFSPNKVMLHQEDANMIMQNKDNPNSLYRMDLETGKVVDEWKIHDDVPVKIFEPESKFSQMTGEQTFLGLSDNALFRIDPRLAGNKLVDAEYKPYASKVGFSAAATTEQGYIAAASDKGSIRLFDRLGIRAKTEIPALGDPMIGLDVSADGRWILATTRTYLLLIDAQQKEGKNEGKLGFEKSFAKDSKPQPKRLQLKPSHVAQLTHETKAPLSFTPAKFNTGPDTKETTIVTATGPFIVAWSLRKVLAGKPDPYTIKRYAEVVKADNFRFGSDKNVIVALPNDVNMVAKKQLQKPTRESIMLTPRQSGAGRRSRGFLGRDDIVNSPY